MTRQEQRLADLADECDREACSFRTSQAERRRLLETASLYRRMICNRAAADPATHTLDYAMLIDITERWCRQHGYRAVTGMTGLVLQRGSEPALVAQPGDTLRWDGQKISISTRDAVPATRLAR